MIHEPFSSVTYVPIEYAGIREVIMLMEHAHNMKRVIENPEYLSHIANGNSTHFVNELRYTENYLKELQRIQSPPIYE